MKKAWLLPIVVLLAHAGLSINAARRLSPTWDEIAYPAAGLAQLETGSLNLNTVNPFLSKLFYAAPLLLVDAPLPLSHPSWVAADEYRFGFVFTFRNRVRPQRLLLLSRLPAIFFSILTATLLYLWITSLWGPAGGLLALVCYVTTPVFLSRAALAQLEMPTTFFILLALWLHWKWSTTNRFPFLVSAGVCTGLAALGKLIALPLLPTFVIINLLGRPKIPLGRRFVCAGAVVMITLVTIVLAYAPWRGGAAAFQNMALNLIHFDKILPFFWNGQIHEQASSLISWPAFLIKAPLHVLFLGGWGAIAWKKSHREKEAFFHLSLFAACSLGSVLFFKNAVSTIQLSPTYLGLAAFPGALAAFLERKKTAAAAIAVTMVAGAASVFAVHPNYLAYFNALVGGSNQGYRWLADSDQDWGQSLPALADFLRASGDPGVVLAYSGSGDPEAYGIVYQDLVSPALVTRERTDHPLSAQDSRVFLVVSAKVFQTEPWFGWLLENVKPDAIVGQTFFVYDISHNFEAFRWLGFLYSKTGRPALAKAALARAR